MSRYVFCYQMFVSIFVIYFIVTFCVGKYRDKG